MKKVLFGLMILAISFSANAQLLIQGQYGKMIDTSVILRQADSLLGLKMNTSTATSMFLTPTGSAAALTNFPIFNQNTTGSAGSFTGALTGGVTGTQGATVVGKVNGVSLAGLASGIYKNTTGTGIPSIALPADFPILNQSTTGNAATVTTNANLTGAVTSVGNVTTISTVFASPGTYSNVVLTVNAAGQITAITAGAATAIPINNEESRNLAAAANSTITILHTPVIGSYVLFKNGSLLPTDKWSLAGATVTLTDARVTADIYSSAYRY